MYTLIYNDSGRILMTTSETSLGSVSAIEAEIPEGYYAESVDTETGTPVLKEIPKTAEQQKLADLEAKQAEDDERYIDQEYRLTLLELGIEDTETA